MSRPEAIKYELDYYTINFYNKTAGRSEQKVLSAIYWHAQLPHKKGDSIDLRVDNKSESESFDNYDDAYAWVQEQINE